MKEKLESLAREHGTPLFVIDHRALLANYREFKRLFPRVQAYYAVKANPRPEIVKTLFAAGASFDVASLPEFQLVYDHVRDWPDKKRQDFIWDKIIYAHPVKDRATLEELDQYRPLVVFDNQAEIAKIRRFAPRAGLVLRLKVPNTGSVVELSSKFGAGTDEAADLIAAAQEAGLVVEGLSFHVGSQCLNYENYMQALDLAASVFAEAADRGFQLKLLNIGGGFPVPYGAEVKPLSELAPRLNAELDRLFPAPLEILAEPGRFLVASACTLVAEVIGKATRDGKPCYYLNDGVYGTWSGVMFDHFSCPVRAFKEGPTEISAVFGPTCDALDVISLAENLPELELGDLVYSEMIGAYSVASATRFNGMGEAKVVSINLESE